MKTLQSVYAVGLALLSFCASGQNSYPSTGIPTISSGGDQMLFLKDNRAGTNWNYLEWRFSNDTRDWVMGRHITTGYFTLYRQGVGEVISVDNAGKVGIGTTAPATSLDVAGVAMSRGIRIPGRYSFGYAESALEMEIPAGEYNAIRGVSGAQDVGAIFFFDDTWQGGSVSQSAGAINLDPITAVTFGAWNNPMVYMRKSDGNVGIGTTNPGAYKLAVGGKIGAREVNVTTDAWSDYVFSKEYKLRPLSEVQQFIDEHHHLPEVPSENEVLANGQNLGEMNAILLKKVEELTLYVIELEKQIKAVERRTK